MFGFLRALFGKRQMPVDFPPKPKWKPNVPVDLAIVAGRAGYYTDHSNVVVIFQHGTCVVLHPECKKPEEEAHVVLHEVFHQHPDFNPHLMDDGNWMVNFSKPNCLAIVTKPEFETHQAYIRDNHLDGLVQGEVLLNAEQKPAVFDELGMIGLFGRARMFMDAQSPVIAKIVRPEKRPEV
jgi:hypothetical protein